MKKEKRVLYKKNERFAIKHIVTDFDNIEKTTRSIEQGDVFSDTDLKSDEAVDIIDITYLKKSDVLHIMLHYAIIKRIT